MIPIILFIGVTGSIGVQSTLPIIGALAICVIVQEFMMYDLHRHLLYLEDESNG